MENLKKSNIDLSGSTNDILGIIESESSLNEEVVEEVVAEEKEESQPTIEEETKEEVVAEETTEENSEVESEVVSETEEEVIDHSEWAKEQGYVSKEEIENLKEDWEFDNKPKDVEYSPFLQSIIDAEKNGQKVDDAAYWKFQTEDISATAAKALTDKEVGIDMIADSMILDDPNAPEDKLKGMLRRKYRDMLSGDYDSTDPEYQDAEYLYESDVRKAEGALTTFQKEAKLSQNPEVAQRIEAEETAKQLEEIRPKAERQYKRKVSKYIDNNKTFSFKSGGEVIEYELSKKEVAQVTERLNSMIDTIPSLITVDGLNDKPIEDGLLKDATEQFLWSNEATRDVLIEKASNHKASLKVEETTKKLKNSKPPESNGSKVEHKELSVNEQIAQNFLSSKRKF